MLTRQPPEVLPALRAAKALARWDVRLALGRQYGEDGALLPEAEVALCRAVGVMRGMGVEKAALRVSAAGIRIQPVGGQAEVGPGRRNHAPWLEAVAKLGVTRLTLQSIALSHQDMDTLSRCSSLQTLELVCTSYPVSALPRLARLPSLGFLALDCDFWVTGAEGARRVCEPLEARGALLALCSDDRWAGRSVYATLYYIEGLDEALAAQLRSIVASLGDELGRLGVDTHKLQITTYG
ncbi:hypothetical protein HYH03_018193 [Edaphochlamys debaryana]|uniref:Uncharacterized protein n=1 Tax=Edaphochlamys debaryana TaxID=47281 RepID=A0A835XF38_9CHLO|nr:hypothetical protein HYH03_018193 [Edaphochlamys debaryana]|eukprot:KAG2482913.1 hypothetical protein HYH03_018193 [Edaphochlamys debaryana]